jgi:hypothetical protein
LAQNQTELSKQIEELKTTVLKQGQMMSRLLEVLDGRDKDQAGLSWQMLGNSRQVFKRRVVHNIQAVLYVTVSLGMNDLPTYFAWFTSFRKSPLPSRIALWKALWNSAWTGTNMALVWLDLWKHFRDL